MANLKGVCEEFCSSQEKKMRIKEHLLHFYEIDEKKKPAVLIACYSRSAAGNKTPNKNNLRTPNCLKRTIDYLFTNILIDKRKSFYFVYDFIFDRLRAIRQEIIIQRFNAKQTIPLLEAIVMFLVYSRYILCEENIDRFDAKICEQHLQECLKQLLVCYEELNTKDFTKDEQNRRAYCESLYLAFNFGSYEVLQRSLNLPPKIRYHKILKETYNVAINYWRGNIYRVLQKIKELPHILCAICILKLPIFRRTILESFAHAYNSDRVFLPQHHVSHMLIYDNDKLFLKDCENLNINIEKESKCLKFCKLKFNKNASIQLRRENFVDAKLNAYEASQLLLFKIY